MAAPRAIQVIRDNVELTSERYEGYQKHLVDLLVDLMAAVGGGATATQRRRDLTDAIKAKASTIGTPS